MNQHGLKQLIDQARRRQLLENDECAACLRPFERREAKQRFCSEICRKVYWSPIHKRAHYRGARS